MGLKRSEVISSAVHETMSGRDLPKTEEMQTTSIRLQPSDLKTLRTYFRARGLSLSAGARMVILDFLTKNVR